MPSAHTEEKEVVARTSKKGSCVKLPFNLLAEVLSPCGKSSHSFVTSVLKRTWTELENSRQPLQGCYQGLPEVSGAETQHCRQAELPLYSFFFFLCQIDILRLVKIQYVPPWGPLEGSHYRLQQGIFAEKSKAERFFNTFTGAPEPG